MMRVDTSVGGIKRRVARSIAIGIYQPAPASPRRDLYSLRGLIMYFFKAALTFTFLAGSALAQGTLLTLPPPGSTLTTGSNITVQVGMGGYPENIDVVAIVIGLMPCYGGSCSSASSFMGDILYQGPYTPQPGSYFENYTVTVPPSFPPGEASLNVINLFMVGASYEPIVDYLNETVTVVA
ncbi:hypothetical protein J3R82DRAFT_8981 [Butyriboletus roseoflavus]|nr:hypothetical protein J3R82DRAFT_8981 [Butyriboletus roseoflavus]